jgi:hypothetical protein
MPTEPEPAQSRPTATPAEAPRAPGPVRAWTAVADAVALGILLCLRIRSWPPLAAVGQRPLEGPDSGDWATNARALLEGGPLSPTRPPLYTWLTVAASGFVHDVVYAGYLVNLIAGLAAVLVAWLLGRTCLTRPGAFVLAWLVAVSPELVQAQHQYGVDPSFHLAVLVSLTAGLAAMRGRAWRLLMLGPALGLLASSHFLGRPWALGLAALVLLRPGSPLKRLGALGLVAALGLGTMALLHLPYQGMGPNMVFEQFRIGLASSFDDRLMLDTSAGDLAGRLLSRLGSACVQVWGMIFGSRAWHRIPAWMPLVLLPLGLARVALPTRVTGSRWSGSRGVWLACVLAPAVLLAATAAPERYRNHLQPIVLTAVIAGVEALVLIPLQLLRSERGLPWAWAPIALLGGLALGSLTPGMVATWSVPTTEMGAHDRRVGLFIAEHFPPGGRAYVSSQEQRFYARQSACFVERCELDAAGGDPSAACLAQLARACGTDRDLPYALDEREARGFADTLDRAHELLEAWMRTHGTQLGVIADGPRRTTVYRVPREVLQAVSATAPGAPGPGPGRTP